MSTKNNQDLFIYSLSIYSRIDYLIQLLGMIDQFFFSSNLENDRGCIKEIVQFRSEVVRYSGRNITSLGSFQECINLQNLKYGLIQIANKTTLIPIASSMGLCLPKECQKSYIEAAISPVLESMGFIGKYIQSPQYLSHQVRPAFYLAVGFLSLIIILVLFSTIFEKSIKNKLLCAFNLKSSIKIFQYRQNKLNVFNGLKAIFILLIIHGHLVLTRIFNVVNALTINEQVESPFALFSISGFLLVDVYFYISGFLLGYLFMKNKLKSIISYPVAIFRRFWKLWPSYLLVVLIFSGVFSHLGYGPVWYKFPFIFPVRNCDALWKNIFLVDNLVHNGEKMCMEWGWYLQNDFQLFVLSVLIIYLFKKNRKVTITIVILIITSAMALNFALIHSGQHMVFVKWGVFGNKFRSYITKIYIKPWIRCSGYLLGLIMGILYWQFVEQQKEQKIRIGVLSKIKKILEKSQTKKHLFSLLGFVITLSIFIAPRSLQLEYKWSQKTHSLFLSLGKTVFVIGISILTLPSLLGFKNDLFMKLMDNRVSYFLSKISFWLYLVHYLVVIYASYSQKTDYFYSLPNIFQTYILCLIASILFAVIGVLFVEVPFSKVGDILISRINQKFNSNQEEKNK